MVFRVFVFFSTVCWKWRLCQSQSVRERETSSFILDGILQKNLLFDEILKNVYFLFNGIPQKNLLFNGIFQMKKIF